MIYTFYSYKGGVGRTMALANIAELFYQAGLKVLMVDWDLEAPGLERFFPSLNSEEILDKPGVIDMLLRYKEQMAQEPDGDQPLKLENPAQYIIDVYPEQPGPGKLLILTAGRRSKPHFAQYAQAVLTFAWQDFYENWGGELYFDWLREQFESIVDVILIDSRTGVTEIGGVCTYQLADTVVMFCSPNEQSVDGTYEMVFSLTSPEVLDLRRGRPLSVLVIPARIERAEGELLDEFKREFKSHFGRFFQERDWIDTEGLWDLRIPYVPKYAFTEAVAARESDLASAEDMVEAFRKLQQALGKVGSGHLDTTAPDESSSGIALKDWYRQSPQPLLVLIAGPSGSGKDSILMRMKERGYPFYFVISATDRPPRPHEVQGRDYYFYTTAEFERMIGDGEMLEHARVYGQYRGVPKAQIRQALASGQDVVMRLDVQGAMAVKRHIPGAVSIFLACETEQESVRRLRERRTESSEALLRRMETIRQEMTYITQFDYVVTNYRDRLDDAVDQIAAIISSEKSRTSRRRISVP